MPQDKFRIETRGEKEIYVQITAAQTDWKEMYVYWANAYRDLLMALQYTLSPSRESGRGALQVLTTDVVTKVCEYMIEVEHQGEGPCCEGINTVNGAAKSISDHPHAVDDTTGWLAKRKILLLADFEEYWSNADEGL